MDTFTPASRQKVPLRYEHYVILLSEERSPAQHQLASKNGPYMNTATSTARIALNAFAPRERRETDSTRP
jgi:hypothetical protein